eukprot:Sspe_Gene.16705::Locus_5901_Transcript_1_1_Confidence_1.000_Length_2636::g.16705::m.16705
MGFGSKKTCFRFGTGEIGYPGESDDGPPATDPDEFPSDCEGVEGGEGGASPLPDDLPLPKPDDIIVTPPFRPQPTPDNPDGTPCDVDPSASLPPPLAPPLDTALDMALSLLPQQEPIPKGRLKSPPPMVDAVMEDTASAHSSLPGWRFGTDEGSTDSEMEEQIPSRAQSLHSCGRDAPSPMSPVSAVSASSGGAALVVPTAEPATPAFHPVPVASRGVIRGRSGASTPDEAPAKKRHTLPHRRKHKASRFLSLPLEVLTPICSFASFAEAIALRGTCTALHNTVPQCMEFLDITNSRMTQNFLVLLLRLTMEGMRLKYLSVLSAHIGEKHSGVFGFILSRSPFFRALKVMGTPDCSILREVVKHCSHLREFQVTGGPTYRAHSFVPVTAPILASLLEASTHLHAVALGRLEDTEELNSLPVPTSLHHSSLRILELNWLSREAIKCRCSFPSLTALTICEGRGGAMSLEDVMNILWDSPNLKDLSLRLTLSLTVKEVRTLAKRCPHLEHIRLKATPERSEQWRPSCVPEQLSGECLQLLLDTFPLADIQVEAAGWDSHWTSYNDLVSSRSLVLQTSMAPLVAPLTSHFANPESRLRALDTVVLCGDVHNDLIGTLLLNCVALRRLELYILGHSQVDDSIFSPPIPEGARNPFPYTSLRTLHIHDASADKGIGKSLSAAAVEDLGTKFPALTRLGLLGLCSLKGVAGGGTDEVLDALANGAPLKQLQHFVHGPLLRTSAELLNFLMRVPCLEELGLAWHYGDLPSGDGEFPSALGIVTMHRLVKEINPKLMVNDVGCGYFSLLLSG